MSETKSQSDRKAVLKALHEAAEDSYWGDEAYFPFASIMKRTKLDRATVRRQCRVLRRQGNAEYRNGLWTEDGEVAGSGYRLTDAGRALLHEGQG